MIKAGTVWLGTAGLLAGFLEGRVGARNEQPVKERRRESRPSVSDCATESRAGKAGTMTVLRVRG
jgi:hypothetical protein